MTTETQQLTIARAIAYALKEPWAIWANKRHPDPDCDECRGAGGRRDDDVPDQWYPCECLRAVPLTTLADARAAWVASGGDPERGPCLEWGDDSMDATSVMWAVGDLGSVRVCIGAVEWCRGRSSRLADVVGSGADAPTMELLARIIRAVEEVTRG